ncbi:MAG: AbrB/MazE/SpoVT family DNA-binding domain-containing protein [Parvibaculum sp.]
MTDTLKLRRIGNSTGLILPKDLLAEARLQEGDSVSVTVRGDAIEITRASREYDEAMAAGRAFSSRYARTMRDLAK